MLLVFTSWILLHHTPHLPNLPRSWLRDQRLYTLGTLILHHTDFELSISRFGSVVVDDPAEMTRMIFEATRNAGVRALVSTGWVRYIKCLSSVHLKLYHQGGLGQITPPPHVFHAADDMHLSQGVLHDMMLFHSTQTERRTESQLECGHMYYQANSAI